MSERGENCNLILSENKILLLIFKICFYLLSKRKIDISLAQ